jgi:endonuclease/exonuclease/phosphatase (EEP) superfamily protein YafD
MTKILRRLAELFALPVVAVLLLGFAQRLHPALDSLAHFRLHFTVLLGLWIAVLLLLRSWTAATVSIVLLAVSIFMMPMLFGANRTEAPADITLLQFNTRYDNAAPLSVIPQVEMSNADFVALQEVSSRTAVILDHLRSTHPHQQLCEFASVGGTAVASRWPILAKGCRNGLAWMQVDHNGQKITIASLHLHWPWPAPQYAQVSEIEPELRGLPQPVILAGDFNAGPWSNAVARVAAASSTHVSNGVRLTWTVNPKGYGPWPFLPIDHILLPLGAAAEVHTGALAGSDHLPVIARIALGR